MLVSSVLPGYIASLQFLISWAVSRDALVYCSNVFTELMLNGDRPRVALIPD